MLTRPIETLDGYSERDFDYDERQFDLVTFPEAFIDSETLLAALEVLSTMGPSGCFHVGLRSGRKTDDHLFSVPELKDLVRALLKEFDRAEFDLEAFRAWLADQDEMHFFNVGCMFLNDAQGKTRICLHPKLVRSKYEASARPEEHMCEANLLTLVTLIPERKALGTITLQPLVCSDALNLQTDALLEPPMAAVCKYAGCFGEMAPDHIDIVSVAACTPQVVHKVPPDSVMRSWHERYRECFVAAARGPEPSRHHFATIVLANFQEIKEQPGGLSGAFLPVPPKDMEIALGTQLDLFGKPKEGGNRWALPQDDISGWMVRGYVASLMPVDQSIARILGFTLSRLLRESSPWEPRPSLTEVDVRMGNRDADGKLRFVSEGNRRARR